ncbi:MAG: ATP-grasp domain-containing protein [bacterium]|nr:ATP-grasp domain-containing protein [bacterium]
MSNVVFVAPFAFDTTLRFVNAAAAHPGARLALVSQDALEKFPAELRGALAAHRRIDNALDDAKIAAAVEDLARQLGPVDRLLGTLEQLQVPLAAARERLGIEGMGVEAAENFRDKARMKTVLRAASLPCARHRLIASADDARELVREVGYPIVIKPPDGAGAKATFSVDSEEALSEVLLQVPPHPNRPLLGEEFIQGSEHSFDGVSIGGELVWHSLTHYLPTPLDVVRNPWIQWCVLLPREIDDPRFDDVREAAGRSLDALGMTTGVSHLEWFRRGDGSIAISEVGARPGGAQISKLISYAHDFDFYRAWARLEIDHAFDPPERAYAAGAAFLRGQGRGRVKAIRGLAQAQREIGSLVVESNLPRLGQSPSSSYEGEGFVILRHRETQVVDDALHRLISLIRVELG